MKIGIVSHAYYPFFGGVTEHVAGSAEALRDLGHQVTVITARSSGARPSTEVVRLGQQLVLPLHGASVNVTIGHRLRERLRSVYRALSLDVVHVHSPLTPMLPLAALRAGDDVALPVVGTFHAAARRSVGYQLFRSILQRDFERLSRRIAVSEPARAFVGRYFDGPVGVVPNGVDLERFRPSPPADDDRPPTVLFVGRLDPRKGVEYLIEAMPRVAEHVHGAQLVIVGDGPRHRSLRRRAARLDVPVRFAGAVSPARLTGFYRDASVVCSPATCNESFGIVVLEAMACGRPVVVSDISGYRQLVQEGRQGHLVAPRDPRALADRLTSVLADTDRARRLGARARARAEEFGWSRVGRALSAAYADLAGHEEPAAEPALALREAAAVLPTARTAY